MNINVPTDFESDNYGYIFHLLRIAKNWKLKDIENQFNICKSYVTVVEKSSTIKDKMLEKFCFIYDISRSQLERIHNTSKVKHKWDYQKTLKDIIDYYLDKKYFEENY